MARSNHVTFGIYYTEAYDADEEDEEDDTAAGIVCNLANDLQEEKDIDFALFTQAHFYSKLAVEL